jgi:DNA polymerase-3 subunit gamma/tau
MIKHTKNLLMCKISQKLEMYNEDEKKQMEETAEKTSKEELINIIYKLSELENKMKISSQKIIIFETEIIKLCAKFETKRIEDRITNSENQLFTPRPAPNPVKIEKKTQEKEIKESEKAQVNAKSIPEPKEEEIVPVKLTEGTPIKEWQNIVNKLKTQGKVMLYANLINTEAITANDMTVVIRFNNGLNSFREDLLKKPENMNILTKEISMICGKPMRSQTRRRK